MTGPRRPTPALGLLPFLLLACCAAAGQPDPGLPELPDEVDLADGDTLRGRIVERGEGGVVLDHPTLGRLTLAPAQIAAVRPAEPRPQMPDPLAPTQVAPEPQPEPEAEPKKPEPPAKDRGLFGTKFLEGYNKNVNLGLTGTSGNTDTLNTFARLRLFRDAPEARTELKADYWLNHSNGRRNRNRAEVVGTRDFKFPDEPQFLFVRTSYEYDEFQPWEQRVGLFVGPGYQFVKNDRFELRGRLGVGATYEVGQVNELHPEGLLAVEGSWKITDRQRVTFSNTIFPLLDEFGEYRNKTELAWVIDIDQLDAMQLKVGIENEYETRTTGDAAHNDLKYFTALSIDF